MQLEITLSGPQLEVLAKLAEDHPHSVTIRNEGDPFLLLDLHDQGGTVVDCYRLPYEQPALVKVAP